MDWMCKAMVHRFHEITSLIGKFELVHAHDWMTANSLAYVRDGWGTPGILTMHSTEYGRSGNVFHDGISRWIRDTEAAGCHTASHVIAVSGFLADELQRIYGVPHWKIHVVPNGVAYHHFDGFIDPGAVKSRFGIAPMDPTIFAAGRMMAQKGMDMLVEAVPMIMHSYPGAKFIISDAIVNRDGPTAADFNGDGAADLLLGTGDQQPAVRVLTGSPTDGLSPTRVISAKLDYVSHFDTRFGVADFNADGRLDLAGFGRSPTGAVGVYIWLQPGTVRN